MRIDCEQLEFIDHNLRKILSFVESSTGLEFTITSLFRIGDPGVHGELPVRGCDLRIRNKEIGLKLEMAVNQAWEYDADRPQKMCAILHGDGMSLHLHLQTHPNTELLI